MTEPRGRDHGDWVSAHVFYHDSLDGLIVDLVGPLTTELADRGLADDWFFLRYWDGGNHLRLRVRPSGRAAEHTVRTVIADRATRHLRDRPARRIMSREDYREFADRLSRAEGMTTYAHLFPNNSVHFIEYRPEHQRYGTGPAMAAVERHFAESSRLALALLSAERTAERRNTGCYSLVLLAWLSVEPDVARLGAWADEQLATLRRNPAKLPAGLTIDLLDQRYRPRANQLAELAAGLRAGVARPAGTSPLAGWARSVTRLRDALVAQVESGAYAPPTRGFLGGTPPDGTARARVLSVVDLCAHLMCNRLGTGRTDELYVRYLAMRALSELAERG